MQPSKFFLLYRRAPWYLLTQLSLLSSSLLSLLHPSLEPYLSSQALPLQQNPLPPTPMSPTASKKPRLSMGLYPL